MHFYNNQLLFRKAHVKISIEMVTVTSPVHRKVGINMYTIAFGTCCFKCCQDFYPD